MCIRAGECRAGVRGDVVTIEAAVVGHGDAMDVSHNLPELSAQLVELGMTEPLCQRRQQLSLGSAHHHTGATAQLPCHIGSPQLRGGICGRTQLCGGHDGGGLAGLAIRPDR